jgi:hypothetical protein
MAIARAVGIVLLVGCCEACQGASSSASADGGVDSSADSAGDAGEPTTVVARYLRADGRPIGGAKVVFHGPDGRPRESGTTAEDGSARGELPEGGMVTFLRPDSVQPPWVLFTIGGVQPGEAVVLFDTPPLAATATIARVDIPSLAGASRYELATCTPPSDAQVGGNDVEVPASCLDASGSFAVLANALDVAGHPLAFAQARGVTPTASATTVTLGPWTSPTSEVSLELLHPPTSGTSSAAVSLLEQGIPFRLDLQLTGDALEQARFPVVADFGNAMLFAWSFVAGAPPRSVRAISHRLDGRVDAHVIDLATEALPELYRASARIDDGRIAIDWATPGPAVGTDVLLLSVTWDFPPPAPTDYHVWTMAMPPETPSPVRLPLLPAELASWQASRAESSPPAPPSMTPTGSQATTMSNGGSDPARRSGRALPAHTSIAGPNRSKAALA